MQSITHWSLSGKLAIFQKKQRHSLNIYWEQAGDNSHITLTNFLGSTVLEIKTNKQLTQITDQNNEQYTSVDGEKLIKKLSGMDLPVEQLQLWIKGLPSNASFELNADNLLHSLNDKRTDWAVDYLSYQTVQQTNLPYKLQLVKKDLRLKFFISKWKIK